MAAQFSDDAEKLLERLLSGGEYDDFDQSIILEGEFIECDATKRIIRQVLLGISPINLIIACRYVPSIRENLLLCPALYKHPGHRAPPTEQTDWFHRDEDILDNLELSSVIKLEFIKVLFEDKEMHIFFGERVLKIYEICTTSLNGNLHDTWNQWRHIFPKYARTIEYRRSTLGKLLGIGKTEVVIRSPSITPAKSRRSDARKSVTTINKSENNVKHLHTDPLRVIDESGELILPSTEVTTFYSTEEAEAMLKKEQSDARLALKRSGALRKKRFQRRPKQPVKKKWQPDSFNDAARLAIDGNGMGSGEKVVVDSPLQEIIRMKTLSLLPRFSITNFKGPTDVADTETN